MTAQFISSTKDYWTADQVYRAGVRSFINVWSEASNWALNRLTYLLLDNLCNEAH